MALAGDVKALAGDVKALAGDVVRCGALRARREWVLGPA